MSAFERRARLRTAGGVAARLALGAVFVVAGFSKASAPPQEFAAAVESYHVLPAPLAMPVSRAVAWAELLIGVFLLAGHLPRGAARAAGAFLTGFIALLLLSLARGVAPGDCGCFGSLLHLRPAQAALADLVLLGLALAALRWGCEALSLDRWLDRRVKR